MEPYTCPGDYDVPKLIGNKSIVISSIKTPPQFTFTKQGRNLEPNEGFLSEGASE
jgi:hypothetical protein